MIIEYACADKLLVISEKKNGDQKNSFLISSLFYLQTECHLKQVEKSVSYKDLKSYKSDIKSKSDINDKIILTIG